MARLQLPLSLDQFLDGIISLFVAPQFVIEADHFLSLLPFAAAFFAGAFLAAGFAAAFFATAFLAGAFFLAAFGASSSPSSDGAGATFSFFGRGPMVGVALSVKISVMRSTVISSRYPRLRREFLRR